jgi:3-deoxy-manno-octulosonate cytidylyltransferase (CMP-KDO synthetase)
VRGEGVGFREIQNPKFKIKNLRIIGVIPARYVSTRFPGKPLAMIYGKPMIQWVYERAKRAKLLDEVVVATDDARIEKAVRGFGGKVVMTSARHRSGTDRVAEVARKTQAALVVNIQGDEPLIQPKAIDAAVRALTKDETFDISTLAAPAGPEALLDPDVVKTVCDRSGFALYFSRGAIPYPREGAGGQVLQHIGLYAYRREALQRLSSMAPSRLEKIEKLEQLRALENGLKIKVITISSGWPSVDRPEDVKKVKQLMERTNRA